MADYPIDREQEPGRYWHAEIDHAAEIFKTWFERGDKVVARYRDERDAMERQRSKFNILWSNVQVLKPSLYGRAAKPEVSRRFLDQDPPGRLAATMLERALDYEITQFPDFEHAMEAMVEDRLLAGRGTAWIRYEPVIVQEQIPPPPGLEITNTEEMTVERVASAHSPIDYVYWKDFLHSPARTWDEVWWVLRWVYLTRDEGVARFGEVFNNVPLSAEDIGDKTEKRTSIKTGFTKKAKVAEIWDKRRARVCWLAKDYPQQLDERDDPLQLEGFFPCPKPLLATVTTGSMIPVPDYCEYQDQAEEMDSLTARLRNLIRAIKAVGVYNAEYKEVARLLSEGIDNKLFPVDNWMALSEKGGLKGAVDMLDISTLIQAVGVLYNARDAAKQTIYEICGISDILRGATVASETLGAQEMKAQFGSLRLKRSQLDVARLATDLFRLKAQIICKLYPPEWIIQMSGVQGTTDGQNPQLVQQAVQILRDATIRDFHIAVESDSLAQINEEEEKKAASEAIQAIGGFLKEALPMVTQAPETLPMVSEMLLFLVRRYRGGRGLEAAIERAMTALQQKAATAAQNPQPTKEQIEAQMRQQSDQIRAQADAQTAQHKAQVEASVQQGKQRMDAQLEILKAQQEKDQAKLEGQIKLALASADNEIKWAIAQLQSQTTLQVAQINHDASLTNAKESGQIERMKAGLAPKPPSEILVNIAHPPMIKRVKRDAANRIIQIDHEVDPSFKAPSSVPETGADGKIRMTIQAPAPKSKKVIYDNNGRIAGITE